MRSPEDPSPGLDDSAGLSPTSGGEAGPVATPLAPSELTSHPRLAPTGGGEAGPSLRGPGEGGVTPPQREASPPHPRSRFARRGLSPLARGEAGLAGPLAMPSEVTSRPRLAPTSGGEAGRV